MSSEQIKALALRLSPTARFEANWDAKLPDYALVDLNPGKLVIAKVGDRYVCTKVYKQQSQSYLTTNFTDLKPESGEIDLNKPPAFEDEYELQSNRNNGGPFLQFNPDADRLPPGGMYPALDPMGQGLNGLDQGRGSRGSGNSSMFPVPRRGGANFGLRYDPTSPFDPKGLGGGFPPI